MFLTICTHGNEIAYIPERLRRLADDSGNLVAIECVGNLKTKQPIIDYED